MRAFFDDGVEKMHISWAVEALPTLLHLSLFIFFGGMAIFLFNVDREVFSYVVWWIGPFSVVYGMITLLPLIRQDSPYISPLSTPAWFLYATVTYVTVKILSVVITFCFNFCFRICFCLDFCIWGDRIRRIKTWMLAHISDFGKYHRRWMLKGVEMAAGEVVLGRLSEIDVSILDWTITTLGDDDSLKNFFEAIPGFLNSKLVKHLEGKFPEKLRNKYNDAINGFLDRTWSSNSVDDPEKLRRLDIATNAISYIRDFDVSPILNSISSEHWDEVPQTLEMGHKLAHWCTSNNEDTASYAKSIIARILASVQERDDEWISLAALAFGLPEQDLRENIDHKDDSVFLAILIHITGQSLQSYYSSNWNVLEELPEFDIRKTHTSLQHGFCTLWNKISKEANRREQTVYVTREGADPITDIPTDILKSILKRIDHHYITLHPGTDATPSASSASTNQSYPGSYYPYEPPSYPFCYIASHHPDSSHLSISPFTQFDFSSGDLFPKVPVEGSNSALELSRLANIPVELPSSSNTTTSEIAATSHSPDMTPPTNSVHSSSRQTGASPTAVVAATPQGMCGCSRQDLTSSWFCTWCNCIRVPLLASIRRTRQRNGRGDEPTPTITTSLPYRLSESYDADVASISNSSLFAPPSIGSFIPASRPTDATLPRLPARGLVNAGNMCFANAVLQLLVNFPPFWNLFTELGDLKGKRGAGVPETGSGATPLVDATVRFIKEFTVEEQSPPTQQQSQAVTDGTSRADEEKTGDDVVDSFEPADMYHAMRKKRQLRPLLVRSRAHVAAPCF
jgi:hypothetical protein